MDGLQPKNGKREQECSASAVQLDSNMRLLIRKEKEEKKEEGQVSLQTDEILHEKSI